MKHRFPYRWKMSDGYPKPNGLKAFGTFVCGGGSTMGYKLAGLDHLGGVEIDAGIADSYKTNHSPRHFYVEDIRDFNRRTDLPEELYGLDILDGSPPCSSFSMSGNREKYWGKEKKFREGQKKQILDDLVFEYIETIGKLKPKVAILENVKGLISGNAKAYAKKMKIQFEKHGYRVQVFLLNASKMGVPQRRERVFFIGLRKDIEHPELVLKFNEQGIVFGQYRSKAGVDLSHTERGQIIEHRIPTDKDIGDINMRLHGKNSGFNDAIVKDTEVKPTTTSNGNDWRYSDGMGFSKSDHILSQTFPTDYDFGNHNVKYVVGMSVPPVMMAQIAEQIKEQWLTER